MCYLVAKYHGHPSKGILPNATPPPTNKALLRDLLNHPLSLQYAFFGLYFPWIFIKFSGSFGFLDVRRIWSQNVLWWRGEAKDTQMQQNQWHIYTWMVWISSTSFYDGTQSANSNNRYLQYLSSKLAPSTPCNKINQNRRSSSIFIHSLRHLSSNSPTFPKKTMPRKITYKRNPIIDLVFLYKFRYISSCWYQPLWKNINQLESFPQVGVKIKNVWNHHL